MNSIRRFLFSFVLWTVIAPAAPVDGARARQALNDFLGLRGNESLRFGPSLRLGIDHRDCEMLVRNLDVLIEVSFARANLYRVITEVDDFSTYDLSVTPDELILVNSRGMTVRLLRSGEVGEGAVGYGVSLEDRSHPQKVHVLIQGRVAK